MSEADAVTTAGPVTSTEPVTTTDAPAVKPETEATSQPQGEKTEDTKPKKEGGVGKRIKELVEERNAWREQALRQGQSKEEKPKETDQEPKEAEFNSYSDYLKAVAKWELRQELKAERERNQKSERERETQRYEEEVTSQFAARAEEFKEKTEDYDDVISSSGIMQLPNTPTLKAMSLAVAESEVGPQLLYHLAQNMKEAQRILRLSPYAAAREIGKLEAKLPDVVKPVTGAPAPISPVKPKSQASEGPSENDDMRDWIKKRRKQVHG